MRRSWPAAPGEEHPLQQDQAGADGATTLPAGLGLPLEKAESRLELGVVGGRAVTAGLAAQLPPRPRGRWPVPAHGVRGGDVVRPQVYLFTPPGDPPVLLAAPAE